MLSPLVVEKKITRKKRTLSTSLPTERKTHTTTSSSKITTRKGASVIERSQEKELITENSNGATVTTKRSQTDIIIRKKEIKQRIKKQQQAWIEKFRYGVEKLIVIKCFWTSADDISYLFVKPSIRFEKLWKLLKAKLEDEKHTHQVTTIQSRDNLKQRLVTITNSEHLRSAIDYYLHNAPKADHLLGRQMMRLYVNSKKAASSSLESN